MAPNPFVYHLSIPWYRIPQIAIMSVTIVPLRLMLLSLINMLGLVITCITLYGLDEEQSAHQPLEGWRRRSQSVVHFLGRLVSFCVGFMFVDIKGKQATRCEAPTLVVAPHSTLMDAALIFSLNELPSVIAKQETVTYPILGKLLKITQPILVRRDQKESKQAVIAEIKRRSHSGGLWNQNVIFPEATTTNRKALLPFKQGAFVAGTPIQPITVRYTDTWDSVTWTWIGGPPGLVQWWLSMCKFNIGLAIEFLPVYHPSTEEQNNPELYAENVRKLMAASLEVPCSSLTIDDGRRLAKEAQLGNVDVSGRTKDN